MSYVNDTAERLMQSATTASVMMQPAIGRAVRTRLAALVDIKIEIYQQVRAMAARQEVL